MKAVKKPRKKGREKTDESRTPLKVESAPKAKTKSKRKPKPKLKPRRQYGALPYRAGEHLEILLITTRETGRWVIPKGWPMIGRSPRGSAAREALEEAGVVGKTGRGKLGSFDYIKVMSTGERIPCRVSVYPLAVAEQKASWAEQHQRQFQWLPWEDAVAAVQEPGLKAIIRAFGHGWTARESDGPKKQTKPAT